MDFCKSPEKTRIVNRASAPALSRKQLAPKIVCGAGPLLSDELALKCGVCKDGHGAKGVFFKHEHKSYETRLCSTCYTHYFSPEGFLQFGRSFGELRDRIA